jgi:hypothetical protein
MMSQNLISIQQYAIKHKLSTFATVKLINQGKIKTIKKTVDGEEREFVQDDTAPTEHATLSTAHGSPTHAHAIDYEKEYHILLAKYSALQEKYTTLLESTHAQK